jgi:hypothetical protein
MFVPRVILVFANCCVDEALRSATGAVRIFLYRWTILMVATTFDGDFSQLQILLPAYVRANVLKSSSSFRAVQHVITLCYAHTPELAVVLMFFLLMYPSLLVFGALQRQDEPILPWRGSQTHSHFAT